MKKLLLFCLMPLSLFGADRMHMIKILPFPTEDITREDVHNAWRDARYTPGHLVENGRVHFATECRNIILDFRAVRSLASDALEPLKSIPERSVQKACRFNDAVPERLNLVGLQNTAILLHTSQERMATQAFKQHCERIQQQFQYNRIEMLRRAELLPFFVIWSGWAACLAGLLLVNNGICPERERFDASQNTFNISCSYGPNKAIIGVSLIGLGKFYIKHGFGYYKELMEDRYPNELFVLTPAEDESAGQ